MPSGSDAEQASLSPTMMAASTLPIVRAATAADMPALYALLACPTVGHGLYPGTLRPPPLAQIFRDWTNPPPGAGDFQLVLVSAAGEVLACARSDHGNLAYLTALEHRGQGHGRRLAQAAARHLTPRADGRVWAAYTERDNPASIRILERIGFVFSGLLQHQVPGKTFLGFAIRAGQLAGWLGPQQ